MAKKEGLKQERVNVYLSPQMKEFYMDYSKEMGISMSASMVIALKTYMDAQKGLSMSEDLKKMIENLKLVNQQITK